MEFTPEKIRRHLSDEQFRLYRLIWQRFLESQMTPAVFDQTTVEIAARADRTYDFRVSGSVLKFDGFLRFQEEDKRARQATKERASQEERAREEKMDAQTAAGAAAAEEDDEERRLPELADGQSADEVARI